MIVRPVTRAMEWQKAGHVKRSKCVAACVTGHDTVMPIKKESYSYILLYFIWLVLLVEIFGDKMFFTHVLKS